MAALMVVGCAPLIPCLAFPPLPPFYKPSQSHYPRPTKRSGHFFRPQKPSKIRALSVTSFAGAGNSKVAHANSLHDLADLLQQVPGEGEVVYADASPKKSQSLLEKGKMGAAFLVKVPCWTSLAATTVVGLPVAICAFVVLKVFNPSQANRMGHFIGKTLNGLYSGKLVNDLFSFVFEVVDPKQGIEEQRWKLIGQYIALNGGVVAAEELAPYLDLKTTQNMDDECYMLPVLLRFDGQPRVDEEGNILYHFPSVHCTPPPRRCREKEYAGRWVDGDIQVDKFLKETKWKFSKLDAEEIDFQHILLFQNLIFGILWGMILRLCSRSYLSRIFLPLFQMYDFHYLCYMITVSIRRSFIKKRNAKIVERNEAREERAKALELPHPTLKRKLLSARRMARKMSIGSGESELCQQQDHEIQEWDQRFKGKLDLISLLMFELNEARLRIFKVH